ncbi:glycerol-3-phosphate transporter ATP-binding subunit [Pokkaliibacter plantistimulans]|uniref:Glycerol-3-phosphate transporter ATP-binding subunit n=1 Tax=Pokkaliibacter plantistimulans TaxID=1635171 RepID=A0ABX5LUZ8_9GAMM|nr:sn-glycerol-3-phosphate import ATP-binding protein UgpC [Pokkaliibacter plantistimulans]PXF29283.1 glycerol-3-phosphate transporter ATP-binding subunit [Pokkaliibacter plantistimulans]
MAEVILNQVGKTYPNGYQAIPAIDLHIADGEFIVLVGPSGCGKSTLLRMVAGLESISSGELLINNQRMNEKEPAERDIAMVFQNYALYPHMTVFDNMAYGLRNRGASKDEIQRKVSDSARLLGLTDLLERKPKQLSGGQRQRVAMGRAMVRHPQAFLFDEPLSNLDAKLRVQMRVEIRQLQRQLGTTTLYVTHDQVEAMTLADRLVVLNKGHAEQIGSPLELYERPATTFVAEFIGSPSMNLLPVSITDQGLQLTEQVSLQADTKERGAVIWGIRPEHLQPCSESEADFALQVKAVEALGAESLIYGHTAGRSELLVVRAPGPFTPAIDQMLYLRAPQQQWHLFDINTQQRI